MSEQLGKVKVGGLTKEDLQLIVGLRNTGMTNVEVMDALVKVFNISTSAGELSQVKEWIAIGIDNDYFESISLLLTSLMVDKQDKLKEEVMSPDSVGTIGDTRFDSTNMYICIATNSWKKITLEEI